MPRLVVLTDRSQLPLGRSLRAHLRDCADAGLTHVVLRELDLSTAQRAALAGDLTDLGLQVIAARTPLPGCVGVHLAGADPLVPSGGVGLERRHIDHTAHDSPNRSGTTGRSCHSRAEVRAAAQEGADYAFLSPYAEGGSKPGRTTLLPGDFADHPIPVLALGGVGPSNAAQARAAGAHGVAVMGAVMRAADPAPVVAALLEATR